MTYEMISGFADEICPDFNDQLDALSRMGIKYVCIRSANGKSIADFTPAEAEEELLIPLTSHHIQVSSLGSPIGKIGIEDEAAFEKQLKQLENLCGVCRSLNCRYIRIFSFYMPEGKDPAEYSDLVIEKMKKFVRIAEENRIVLLHENEKDIYGDTGLRCLEILEKIDSSYLKAAFDFANFVQCGEDPEKCWELLKDFTIYIHVKDALFSNRENVLAGTGDGMLLPILKDAFENQGYHGFLTLEPHLFAFIALKSLEKGGPNDVTVKNRYASGEEAFEAQYKALLKILSEIH
ncbi:MAG: sugar phosphate isomerase/epimerase [Firmicutes bacterium]|nr:sugar phosphate isomerase/epimerase [Bacillota bacterium]